MASKLEEKTKDYGAQLILSEQLVNKMSPDARSFVRPIDKIKFNDGEEPISIIIFFQIYFRNIYN
jgi:hypothetical protein